MLSAMSPCQADSSSASRLTTSVHKLNWTDNRPRGSCVHIPSPSGPSRIGVSPSMALFPWERRIIRARASESSWLLEISETVEASGENVGLIRKPCSMLPHVHRQEPERAEALPVLRRYRKARRMYGKLRGGFTSTFTFPTLPSSLVLKSRLILIG